MTVIWTVRCSQGNCVLLRTLDQATAVWRAKAEGRILDALPARTADAERRLLTGETVTACVCEESTDDRK